MKYLEIFFNGVLKQSIPVQSDVISIGRSSNNDIVIKNMGVSNHHALIIIKDNQFYLEDLNSTNGTFLNSEIIRSKQNITLQDSIVIGKHTLKFSEWSQKTNTPLNSTVQESDDSTVMMNSKHAVKETPTNTKQPQYYLTINGELTGIKKLLLGGSFYNIGKAKDNKIRIKGWLTPAYIAEIEKIGHSYYLIPLKRKKTKLNGSWVNSTIMLSPLDEIKIKKLVIKFLAD